MQQVIYLEVEDDLPAVRDLLEGAQAKRVLLVVPKGSGVFREQMNLRILRRAAANLALDVALVTRDSRTRRMAKEEGIPVLFRFVEDAAGDGEAVLHVYLRPSKLWQRGWRVCALAVGTLVTVMSQ